MVNFLISYLPFLIHVALIQNKHFKIGRGSAGLYFKILRYKTIKILVEQI